MMKLLCLGTGAADWTDKDRVPGPAWRNFTSTLMDGTLLVDPGPHIFRFAAEHGMPDLFDNVTDVLVTHSHGDHFSPTVVKTLWEKKPRRLIGGFGCMQCLTEYDPFFAAKVDFTELKPFEGTAAAGFDIFTLPANHSTAVPGEIPFHYILQKDGKSLYYGLDGAWMLRESWNAFRKWAHFDAMILDATVGDGEGDLRIFEHNNLRMVEEMVSTFRKLGTLKPDGKVYVDHMAKTLHTDHETLVKRLAPSGITPCFDGMDIEV